MSSKLHTYALLKTLFDKNKDFLDTLSPLVLQTFNKGTQDLSSVQKKLKDTHTIEVPILILKTVTSRAVKSHRYLQTVDNVNFKITTAGEAYLGTLEPSSDVERRTNSFLFEVVKFFATKESTIDLPHAKKIVEQFVQDNIDGLVDFINPKAVHVKVNGNIPKIESGLLVEFIEQIQVSRPVEYAQFQEIIFGSILSSLLCSEDSAGVQDTQVRKMKKASIFIDTNILLSLLELHSDESNKGALELVTLLKSLGYKLYAFDFTLDELCRVLNAYISKMESYPTTISIDDVYSVMRRKGWGVSDVSLFIENVDQNIEKLGVKIYPTSVNLNSYISEKNEALRSKISAHKNTDSKGLSACHDLASIDQVREIRRKNVRRMEDVEAFFLTNDFHLQRTVLYDLGHKENGTISEVILDRVFASLLWLKNPSLNLPLTTVIASHSRDLLIDRRVWERFHSVLSDLREKGTLSESQIDGLFYRKSIEDALIGFGREDLSKIDKALVMSTVEEAVQSLTDDDKKLAEKTAREKRELADLVAQKDKVIQESNKRVIENRKQIRMESGRFSKTVIILFSVAFCLVTFWIEALLLCKFYHFYIQAPKSQTDLISLLFGSAGLSIISVTIKFYLWLGRFFHPMYTEIVYKDKIKYYHIETV